MWALDTEGMLQRNNLLSEEHIRLLTDWFDTVFYRVVELIAHIPENPYPNDPVNPDQNKSFLIP